jgi:peroxiredoxin Q/BCP
MQKTVIFLFTLLLVSCGGSADNISVGDLAPNFTLEDHENNSFTLSDFRGKSPVVVYFYPKASTPGCTKQACGVRDDYSKFDQKGIKIFGISVDSKEDIKEFVQEYDLNFPLLSDNSKEISKAFGVLNNIGKASRITFIIDKEGKIANIIRDVDIDSHAERVYELAEKLI